MSEHKYEKRTERLGFIDSRTKETYINQARRLDSLIEKNTKLLKEAALEYYEISIAFGVTEDYRLDIEDVALVAIPGLLNRIKQLEILARLAPPSPLIAVQSKDRLPE